jgi:N-acyl-D-amino-acid deacylase
VSADLVIRGGSALDGTGAPERILDVAIRDGKIVALGKDLEAGEVIDASGKIVAPGFIDLHSH